MSLRTLAKVVAAAAVGVLLSGSPRSSADDKCTQKEALAAEVESGMLRSWSQIHASYVRYSKCDDGHIAEGYSESISLVLDEKWQRLSQLQNLIRRDERFQGFVLKHLDELVPVDRLAGIQARARERCAPNLKQLCSQIASAIQAVRDRNKPKL